MFELVVQNGARLRWPNETTDINVVRRLYVDMYIWQDNETHASIRKKLLSTDWNNLRYFDGTKLAA